MAQKATAVLGINYHKLRNVMGGISGLVQLSEVEAGHNDELLSNFSEMLSVIRSFDDGSREAMNLYRGEPLHCREGETFLANFVTEHSARRKRVFSLADIDLSFEIPDSVVLPHHDEYIAVLVDQLISNAYDACKGGQGRAVSFSAEQHADTCVIRVEDSGRGIPYAQQRHIFTPFFTTKNKHLGVGLYTLRRYVETWGGRVSVYSVPQNGTTITLHIPL